MVQDMALPKGVKARGPSFFIQIKVPVAIKALFSTIWFIRETMDAKTHAEAIAEGYRHWADATEAFAAARAKLKPPQAVTLTPALLGLLHERIRHTILSKDDERRAAKPGVGPTVMKMELEGWELPDDQFERLTVIQNLEKALTMGLGMSLATGNNYLGRGGADHEARILGFTINWKGQEVALQALTRTAVQAYSDTAKRTHGEPIQTPQLPQVPADFMAPITVPPKCVVIPLKLRDIVPHWWGAKTRKQDSLLKTQRALTLFEASGQNHPLIALTRPHGAALRAYLIHPDRPFKDKTALNHWTALQALMNLAVDVGLLERNPWRGMTLEVTDSEEREVLTDEELQQLFHAPLFLKRDYPIINNVRPDDAYWCMLIGLWTGARVGEIAQLEISDVLVQNGLDVFSIRRAAGTVKTTKSARITPIAPELLRLGFIEWATARREAGAVRLFQSLNRGGAVTPGETMTEWNRQYRLSVGAAMGPLNGYHRFRHTIVTAMAALDIRIDTGEALTGHSSKGSSGSAGYTHIFAKSIFAALERVKFPLELPRIYQTPFKVASDT